MLIPCHIHKENNYYINIKINDLHTAINEVSLIVLVFTSRLHVNTWFNTKNISWTEQICILCVSLINKYHLTLTHYMDWDEHLNEFKKLMPLLVPKWFCLVFHNVRTCWYVTDKKIKRGCCGLLTFPCPSSSQHTEHFHILQWYLLTNISSIRPSQVFFPPNLGQGFQTSCA